MKSSESAATIPKGGLCEDRPTAAFASVQLCLLYSGEPRCRCADRPALHWSTACKTCHSQIYERWKKTRMANVVRDPREYPDAILPNLSKPDPLVHFTKNDIALVYGSKWKQRYFKKVGSDSCTTAALSARAATMSTARRTTRY